MWFYIMLYLYPKSYINFHIWLLISAAYIHIILYMPFKSWVNNYIWFFKIKMINKWYFKNYLCNLFYIYFFYEEDLTMVMLIREIHFFFNIRFSQWLRYSIAHCTFNLDRQGAGENTDLPPGSSSPTSSSRLTICENETGRQPTTAYFVLSRC